MPRPASSILEFIRAHAAETSARVALVFQSAAGGAERMSYGELVAATDQRATLLTALPATSRVGLVAPHGPHFLVDALAILATGHCLVPVSETLSPLEKDELADRAGIHALLENGRLKLCPGAPIDDAGDADYRALDPAYLRFTSGSTGRRKGVLLGHRTILERTAAANARLRIGPQDRVLCLLPMVDHFVVSILLYLRYGATILLVERASDAPGLALSEMATVLYGSPAHFPVFQSPLPELRLAVSTTQGLSESVATTFQKNTGLPLSQALGIIEAGLLTLNDDRAKTEPLLAGRPMPDYQISIVGNDGQGAGEIHVAGPGLLDAYVAPWRPRASLLSEKGFPTGDHGWLDQAGYLHLVGRENNRLEIAGAIYFSEELETTLNEHPEIGESLVFLENKQLQVDVVADETPALSEWIVGKLPLPPTIRFVHELPRTPTGKIARRH